MDVNFYTKKTIYKKFRANGEAYCDQTSTTTKSRSIKLVLGKSSKL